MTFVHEVGEQVHLGNPIENGFVHANGELVDDGDHSPFSFINGRGLGQGTVEEVYLSATVYDQYGDEYVSVDATDDDDPYVARGIGIRGDGDENSTYFDNIRLTDGTLIEDFSSGNLDPWTAQREEWWRIDTETTYVGDYSAVHDGDGVSEWLVSNYGDGLPYYPTLGDEIEFWFRISDTNAGVWVGVGLEYDPEEGGITTYQIRLPGAGTFDDELRIVKDDRHNPLATASADRIEDEWLRAVVRYGEGDK